MSSSQFPINKSPILTLTREPCLWIIEMHNGEDNRLTRYLIDNALKPALDIVEREWKASQLTCHSSSGATNASSDGRGALIITGKRSQNKFFSNGLDFASVVKDPGFFPDVYNPLISRLMSFSIPVHFGAPWPLSLAAVARAKVSDARTLRRLSLEGHRFTPQEALAGGFVDVVAEASSSEAVLTAARTLAAEKAVNARTGAMGSIKETIYRSALEDIAKKSPIHARL
ncbi:ClpP/crotonase [Phellopilus nigrolimitatus]|nr:ClpP/crotonase [Phellopilus nigrolimitatus]